MNRGVSGRPFQSRREDRDRRRRGRRDRRRGQRSARSSRRGRRGAGDIDGDAVDATSARLDGIGAQSLGRVADALVTTELDGFYDEFDAQFDHLDVLVNVVGGVRQRRFESSSREQWRDDIHRNFGYAVDSIVAALPRHPGRGRRWQHRELHDDRGPSRGRRLRGVRRRQGRAHQLLARARRRARTGPDPGELARPRHNAERRQHQRGAGEHDRGHVRRRTESAHGDVRYLRTDAAPADA